MIALQPTRYWPPLASSQPLVLVITSLVTTLSLFYEAEAADTLFSAYNDRSGDSQDLELRVAVEPGRHDCFYQSVKRDHNLDLSYQVIEITSRFNWMYSGSNDLTIDFIVKAPNGLEIFREMRKREGQHVHRAVSKAVRLSDRCSTTGN